MEYGLYIFHLFDVKNSFFIVFGSAAVIKVMKMAFVCKQTAVLVVCINNIEQ